MWSRIVVIALLSWFISACSSSQGQVQTVERSESCPAPGTRVPYAQLLSQTRSFVGCDIETEFAYVGAGMGGMVGNSIGRPGETIFRASPPGQAPSGGPFSSDFSYFTVPDAAATPLYSAAAGARFIARGTMEMQVYQGGYDPGNLGRVLRARSVAPAQ